MFRRNGDVYKTIINEPFSNVGIDFSVENGKTYGMKVNARIDDDTVKFYFDVSDKFNKEGELVVFRLPRKENSGCSNGYLGLRTSESSVNFDWVENCAEPGLEGWEINLRGPYSISETVTTGPDGSYSFKNLPAGTCTVSETLKDGWVQTFPGCGWSHIVTLEEGETESCINFGNNVQLGKIVIKKGAPIVVSLSSSRRQGASVLPNFSQNTVKPRPSPTSCLVPTRSLRTCCPAAGS